MRRAIEVARERKAVCLRRQRRSFVSAQADSFFPASHFSGSPHREKSCEYSRRVHSVGHRTRAASRRSSNPGKTFSMKAVKMWRFQKPASTSSRMMPTACA